ncbi:uncharacterized protein [Polyergus mexicanus]|uniref:uncharacterized protein n=1 Tax=Polyergus mexicanus TaxID=615972 RepID=UPI0038B437CC
MDSTTKDNTFTAAVGFGSHSDRRGGDTVPVPPSSSFNDGPPGVLPTSTLGERTIADDREMRVVVRRIDWPGPASSKSGSRSRSVTSARAHPYSRDEAGQGQSLTRQDGGKVEGASRGGSNRSTPLSSSRTSLASEGTEDHASPEEDAMEVDDLPKKRGRGRPPTTGEFVGLREKREEEAARKQEKERERRAQKALSEDAPLPPPNKGLRAYEAECAEEVWKAPTPDIAARSMEQAAAIDRIAVCSGSLQGSLQKRLREAAALVRVTASTLAERAQQNETKGELAALRRDIKFLGDRNADLQREIRELKEELDATRCAKPPSRLELPGLPGGSPRKRRGVPRVKLVEELDVPIRLERPAAGRGQRSPSPGRVMGRGSPTSSGGGGGMGRMSPTLAGGRSNAAMRPPLRGTGGARRSPNSGESPSPPDAASPGPGVDPTPRGRQRRMGRSVPLGTGVVHLDTV